MRTTLHSWENKFNVELYISRKVDRDIKTKVHYTE